MIYNFLKARPQLSIFRGFCDQSYIDRYYVLVFENHEIFFAGQRGTQIIFEKATRRWKIQSRTSEVFAETRKPFHSFALGTNEWTISKENPECQFSSKLTLSSCLEDEFTCFEGSCVSMDLRCDGKVDCPFDESDELECDHVVIPDTYVSSKMAPPLERTEKKNILINVTIIEVLTIDEISSIFEVKFTIFSSWIDYRLTYNNLKDDINVNMIEEKERIWFPKYHLG